MKQLFFDFFTSDNYNLDNFIVNDSNKNAYNFLNSDNIHQIVFLTGEEKSGKTYLTTLWKQKYNAKNIDFSRLEFMDYDEYIENINELIEKFDYYIMDELPDNFDEEKLFYLLNLVLNNNSFILITAKFNILKKKIHLKDLLSRIRSAPVLNIKKFCKKTKKAFILKLLMDKGLFLGDDIVSYLNKKLPNNYKSICLFIDDLTMATLDLKTIKTMNFNH